MVFQAFLLVSPLKIAIFSKGFALRSAVTCRLRGGYRPPGSQDSGLNEPPLPAPDPEPGQP